MTQKTISAEEFDRLFDEGSDEIDQYLDWESVRRPGRAPEPVNVELPQWMAPGLDREAKRRGVTRQALVESWVAEQLKTAA